MQPFLESNDVIDDTSELRQRAEDDGYLFFHNHFNRLKPDIKLLIADRGSKLWKISTLY